MYKSFPLVLFYYNRRSEVETRELCIEWSLVGGAAVFNSVSGQQSSAAAGFKSMLCKNLRRGMCLFHWITQHQMVDSASPKPLVQSVQNIYFCTHNKTDAHLYTKTIRNTTRVLLWVQLHWFVGERGTVDFILSEHFRNMLPWSSPLHRHTDTSLKALRRAHRYDSVRWA